jgi:hypothetical protein
MNNIIIIIIIILIICFLIKYINLETNTFTSLQNFSTKVNISDNIDNGIDISKYVLLCHNSDYNYIKEYIESVFKNNKLIIYDNNYDIINDNIDYLCIRRPPKFVNNTLYKYNTTSKYSCDNGPIFLNYRKLSFLNLEHLTCKLNNKIIMKYMYPELDYYDYSLDNINIYGKGKYLPYIENIEETKKLKKLMNVNKKYDVIFCGTYSKRRKNVIYYLLKKGINIKYFCKKFGDSRDKLIGQSKILLNIHEYNNWRIYESLRCERWRFAGMPIISENCISELPDGIIGCNYNDIYNTIINLLEKLNI